MSLNTGLVAFWKLDEATAAQRNDSVGTSHLADNNSVVQIAGKVGDAASFTGSSSQYLSINDNAALSMGSGVDFTLAAWYWVNSAAVSSDGIISKGGVSEYFMDVTFAAPRFICGGAGVVTAAVQTTGAWHFVVAWYDQTHTNIQVDNGAIVQTASTTDAPDAGGVFYIGRSPTVALFMTGKIDTVGIWKRVLTADERTELWNAGAGLEPPFVSVYSQSVSGTGTFTATLSKQMSKALSAVGTWVATLTATIMEAFRPTVRIAVRPAEDRTAEVPARNTTIVGSEDEE